MKIELAFMAILEKAIDASPTNEIHDKLCDVKVELLTNMIKSVRGSCENAYGMTISEEQAIVYIQETGQVSGKVMAVKSYRDRKACSLLEAKTKVEDWMKSQNIPLYSRPLPLANFS